MTAGERSALRSAARRARPCLFGDELADVVGRVGEVDRLGDLHVRVAVLAGLNDGRAQLLGGLLERVSSRLQSSLHLVPHAFQDLMSESRIPILYRAT